MADKPSKIQFNFNPKIECQVPGEQALRETSNHAANGYEALTKGNTVDIPDTHVPVLKEETFKATTPHQIENPAYSLILDDVISGPHSIRQGGRVKAETAKIQDTLKDPKKRTKIPTRFRQTVDRVRLGGVVRGEGEHGSAGQQSLQPQPRRSSIPKLQKKDSKHPVTAKADSKPDTPKDKDLDIPKADEEFAKIFEEIIEDKSIEYMDAIVLPDTRIDPELETNFEDIIHSYVKDKVEPLPEENTGDSQKSRIPLIKQKSLDEAKVFKSIDRTNSLQEKVKIKTIEFDDKMPVRKPVYAKDIKEVTKEKELVENRYAESGKITGLKPDKETEILKSTLPSLIRYEETKMEENTDRKPENLEQEKHLNDWFKPIDLNEHPSVNNCKNHDSKRDPRFNSKSQIHTEASDAFKTESGTIIEHETTDTPTMSVENGVAVENKQPEKSPEIKNAPTEKIKTTIPDYKLENDYFRPAPKVFTENHKEYKKPPVSQEIDEVLQDIPKGETEEEEIPILKGRVNRLIKQISHADSNGGQKEQESKNIEVEEPPKRKSVLTKIAMFETIEPKHNLKSRIPHIATPKLKTPEQFLRIETVKYEVSNASHDRKPRIIEEVLKTPPLRRKSYDYKANEQEAEPDEITTLRVQQDINNAEQNGFTSGPETVQNVAKTEEAKYESNSLENLGTEIDRKEKQEDKPLPTYARKADSFQKGDEVKIEENHPRLDRTYSRHDEKPIEHFELKSELHKVSNRLPTTESNESKPRENLIENRLQRLKSSTDSDNTKLERSKSIAEIEIEKSVKGKVFHIIQTMKAVEHPETPKKEVISVKERPRKKSVLEKIAMFERKLTPVAMEEPRNAVKDPGQERAIKDTSNAANNIILDGEAVKMRVAELNDARANYGSVSAMPTVELSNGVKMPVLAVGTALLEPALIKAIIGAAIDLGYRAIDTAYIYGNEQLVGEAIRAKIDDGTVKREDLFIMSKIWSTFHRPDLVQKACRASLDALGLDYFDLIMIHNPMSFKEGGEAIPTIAGVLQLSSHEYLDAWAPLEGAVTMGLARAVGVANFNSEQVARVFSKAAYKPVVNQVECHPYLNQQRLSDFCANYDVQLSCYGALGSRGTPAAVKGATAACVLDDPAVEEIAAELGVSPAEILIGYQLERGHAVVAKASTAGHLWENLQALKLRLSPLHLGKLHALNKNRRNFPFIGMGDTHKHYPFNIPF